VRTADGQHQLSVPRGWKEDRSLHDKAEIQVADAPEEMYALVLTDGKDSSAGMDISKYAEATREAFSKSLVSPQVGAPRWLSVNGASAIECEIRGSVQNLDVIYLHTVVETPKHYHQVMAWTLKSQWERNKDTLQAVTESFRELSP